MSDDTRPKQAGPEALHFEPAMAEREITVALTVALPNGAVKPGGVRAASDDVAVRIPGVPANDDEITPRAALSLAWDAPTPKPVRATTATGVFKLTGDVDHRHQSAAAEAGFPRRPEETP